MAKFLKVTSQKGNWIEGTYKGHFFQAKVYDTPSKYGIAEGRTSKLIICGGKEWNGGNIIFNYDRDLEIDHALGHELADILETI